MKTTLCSHADLIDILASGRPELVAVAAKMLNPESEPVKQEEPEKKENDNKTKKKQVKDQDIESSVDINLPVAELPFWRTEAYHLRETIEPDEERIIVSTNSVSWTRRPQHKPPFSPLAQWNQLLPRLKELDVNKKPGKQINLPAAVSRLSKGELLGRMPKKVHQRWGASVQIIIDRSLHLTPYWDDQIRICQPLAALFPEHALQWGVYYEGFDQPLFFSDKPNERQYRLPAVGSLVIVLGDLGTLSKVDGNRKVWQGLGQQLIDNGCRPLALIPSQQTEISAKKITSWNLLNWETATTSDSERRPTVDQQLLRLLTLVSPAIRIEPGFLRSVRRLIDGDASLESLFWQHPSVIGKAAAAATIDPQIGQALRLKFEQEDPQIQIAVLCLLRQWRAELPQEIWFEEIKSLTPMSQELSKEIDGLQQDFQDAENYFINLGHTRELIQSGNTMQAWFCRLEQRLPSTTWTDPQLSSSLNRLWQQNHCNDSTDSERKPPPGYDPKDIPKNAQLSLKTWQLYQHNNKLLAVPTLPDGESASKLKGSWLAQIRSRNGEISIATLDQDKQNRHAFWKGGKAPDWASDWGEDEYGLWVEFELEQQNSLPIVQRMRWIKAGEFLMGSPETEAERLEDEGPQHGVIISQGYWLFDTATQQSLWERVMDENPSYFKGDNRPVELVSWQDIQQFIGAINQKLPGLALTLPSEAQWEYACRAGTTTPFSFGQTISTDQANFNGYHPYDNAKKGHYREETVDVKSFQPNPWGLYQMHGNVDEWCLDGMRDYKDSNETDPMGSLEDGASRVVRGSSWLNTAMNVRSAFRFTHEPEPVNRFDSLGFRCARVHEGAEPAESLQDRSRQQRLAVAQSRVAELIRLKDESRQDTCLWPQANQLLIRSDTEELLVNRLTRPSWADAVGRDRFGLWASFEIPASEGRLSQRLRWIPPGRFMMGSPSVEAGRLDTEGPQHEVTISQGYWLFDTPCTQALWQVVMENNSSEFKSPKRPVESVSWHEVQEFIDKLNYQIIGLNLVLPNEAQWEYACRAGTQTATPAGDLEIVGERNAPVLDKIAWYGGNSGEDFDLPEGYDSSAWPEKQYPHSQAGTREVAGKAPNFWGLNDMLGNVWEWCQDGQRDYEENVVTDPQGSVQEGTSRVVRGGSWLVNARRVRSASRNAGGPGIRLGSLGFRCARVHDPEE